MYLFTKLVSIYNDTSLQYLVEYSLAIIHSTEVQEKSVYCPVLYLDFYVILCGNGQLNLNEDNNILVVST